jgi:2-amino-4-hydroxy-6-hydroxymethyldihydropteridine diphosphokinase
MDEALTSLRKLGDVRRVSKFIETPPYGGTAAYPFLNAACILSTHFLCRALMDELLHIEQNLGRVRTVKWADRIIDLDILLAQTRRNDSVIFWTPSLSIPHPEFTKRDFALIPAREIAPNWIEPYSKRLVKDVALGLQVS